MGNTQDRVIKGLDEIVGDLIGFDMLEKLKEQIITQIPYQKMFGLKGERIFVNEDAAPNETILPLWEFQWDTETVQGQNSFQTGFINSRIIFPNNLSGKYDFFRLVALSIARFFNSQSFLNNFFGQVDGLNEFAENLSFAYNNTYKRGEITVPVLIIRIPFLFDINRFRILNPCTDLDGNLHDPLLRQIESYSLEITDDDIENPTVLIPATEPLIKN